MLSGRVRALFRRNPRLEGFALQRGEAKGAAGAVVFQDKFHGAVAEAAVAVVEEDFGVGGGRGHAEESIARARETAAGQGFAKPLSYGELFFPGETRLVKCNPILEAMGNTPLIRLNRVTKDLPAEVYVKADYLNPGGSMKDRIAVQMIDEAERKGVLRPGGTIVEATSGNTGVGLALVATVRGYKIVFTITDKQSREKIDMLKAFGAEVIVCPTAVEPEDPRSYYSVAKKLAREIPNSYYPNQYENPANPEAHYRTTGPEIWKDTEGKITHFVCGLGTGGTATGRGSI